MAEIHINDIGTAFEVTVYNESSAIVDLSQYSGNLNFYFTRPNGDLLTKTGELSTDGSDGKMYYTAQSGDLNTAGLWQLQCRVASGVSQFCTQLHEFRVHKNLE